MSPSTTTANAAEGEDPRQDRENRKSKYLLAITEIPFGTTTSSLIESILAANAKGKIKIKHIDDNTAEHVEILVHLPPGTDPEQLSSSSTPSPTAR
jgi:DNA gyrase/topoisomerase IV subunit A